MSLNDYLSHKRRVIRVGSPSTTHAKQEAETA